ncbi:protein adenylyltransferase SelO [uncultured Oxalicibacterium sp.]|uniref:protein adenylyltransferase SelO n=1 Tax=uncultured Oxalicibacterium sp. TaxID=1168540 RepID=UPI0025DB2B8B|nr:YdiU family protein [uncultured Oxalicibacterium sp.]
MTSPLSTSTHIIDIDTLTFGNDFASLPPAHYTRLQPTPLPSPYLVAVSPHAAALIGIDAAALQSQAAIDLFTGNDIPDDAQPLSAVYSGHQFGVWAGQLGDGRAILLGDVPAAENPAASGDNNINVPHRMELQLKGAGLTPYSRMGDGRAVLRSSIREFLCSEAMAALGIPTTRALCITGSDQMVLRERPETAAVVTRMAPTFVRFGSFEHWFYNQKHDELKTLADYVLARFYPALQQAENPYKALLTEVTIRTARLMAHWQAVGFMHGVMNTDNMSILGLTLDYGPFGFMEAFDPHHICNHTDQQGRYSYARQPQIGEWNCFALGQALLPLIGTVEDVQAALRIYKPAFAEHFMDLMRAKLGLQTAHNDDAALFDHMFNIMQDSHVDFTRFFRKLGELKMTAPGEADSVRDLFLDRTAFDEWALQYAARLQAEASDDAARKLAMDAVNPKYVLRNYLAQTAIEKAEQKDFTEVARLLAVLEKPFDEQPENDHYADLPPDWANDLEVSCSS